MDIGYELPPIQEYTSLKGFLCAIMYIFLVYFLYWIFAANIWGMYVPRRVSMRIFEYIYLYWIFVANILGIYVTRRVSVRPSGAGSGNIIGSSRGW